MKLNYKNLTKAERAEYMYLQMSPSYTLMGGNLPDDCSECAVCGQPIVGTGWCSDCLDRHDILSKKLRGIK